MNLLLIDGANVVMRYAFAMLGERQSHPDDLDIERVLGGVEWAIRKVAEFTNATHAICAFDSEGETWRKKIYPDYKKSRPPGTAAWSSRASTWLGERAWSCSAVQGFEGDDVVATIAHRAVEKGHSVFVFSGDKDLLQLVDICKVIQFGKSSSGFDEALNGKEGKYVIRDCAYLCDKFQCMTAAEFTVWKALVGDPGDEIPGCKGIGPVKAGKIVKQHGADVDAILGSEFYIEEAQFRLMLQLVSLRTDVPIEPISPATCRVPERRG